MSDIDLNGASRLITGSELDPARQIRLLGIAQKLAIRPDDPVFAVLVALEGYQESFTGMPDRLAEAATLAATEVAVAARAQTERVVAETVASVVDRQVLTRQFRRWAIGSVIAVTLVIGAAAGSTVLTIDRWSGRAHEQIDGAASAAEKRVSDMKTMLVDIAVAAAVQAAKAAAQQAADRAVTDLQNRVNAEVNAEVVAALKIGQTHAEDVRELLSAEVAAPGTLQRLRQVRSQGWLQLVEANPHGPCLTRERDPPTGRLTCRLWAPN